MNLPIWRELPCHCDLDYTCDKHRIISEHLSMDEVYRVLFYDNPELEQLAMQRHLDECCIEPPIEDDLIEPEPAHNCGLPGRP